eukprot:9474584-Pyramimonas_sp.AAC.1
MIRDVMDAAQPCGLEIHPGKTKILHNMQERRPRSNPEQTVVNGSYIEILPYSATQKYLGRQITFRDPTTTEIESRINAAWKKFGLFKHELTTRSYSLGDRLRLFNGVVSPTLLYGAGSWAMTTPLETRVRATQRCMLRMILGSQRRRVQENGTEASDNNQSDGPNDTSDSESSTTDSNDTSTSTTPSSHAQNNVEPWQEWIRRTTRHIVQYYHDLGYEDWCVQQRRRQWRLLMAVLTDDKGKWNRKALLWEPTATNARAKRLPHRPKKRWVDDLTEYFLTAHGQHWLHFGGSMDELEDDYVYHTTSTISPVTE